MFISPIDELMNFHRLGAKMGSQQSIGTEEKLGHHVWTSETILILATAGGFHDAMGVYPNSWMVYSVL